MPALFGQLKSYDFYGKYDRLDIGLNIALF